MNIAALQLRRRQRDPLVDGRGTPYKQAGNSLACILGDKMNLTVRLGKQFSESSPCYPRQLGTGQLGRYTTLAELS